MSKRSSRSALIVRSAAAGRARSARSSRYPPPAQSPEGGHPGLRRGAVAGGEHSGLDTHAPHRPGDPEDLALHPARDAQAVRADHPYLALVRTPPLPSWALRASGSARKPRGHGLTELGVPRPVGLEDVPLGRGLPDQLLELVGQGLGPGFDQWP